MSQRIVEESESAEISLADEELATIEDSTIHSLSEEEAVSQEPQIPSKFKNKSIEDIISSYSELEKEYGRKANEVGELRKLTDDFLRRELDNQEKTIRTPEKETELSFDDLVDDPVGSIDKALSLNPRLKALEEQLQKSSIEKNLKTFEEKHPDWREIHESSNFKEWLNSSKARKTLYSQANDNYDYDLGDELFQMYKDTLKTKKEEATTIRNKQLKDATVETGSTGAVKKKVYRRSDLIKLRMTDPARFDSMQDEIMSAYAEGRVR